MFEEVESKMDRRQYISIVDFHIPTSLIGATLLSGIEKDCFKYIKSHIDKYISNSFDLTQLMKVIDHVEETKRLGHRRSMIVLNHVMTYLRVKLLSREVRVVELSIVMIDLLVKNCSYRIHILVGNRVFMKTIGVVARQLLVDQRDKCRRVGRRMIDILQGWGEAFLKGERRYIYPNIVATYQKMRYKYGVKYRRPDFDPSRVPIFLEAIHQEEILASPSRGTAAAICGDNIEDREWEVESSNGSINTTCLKRITSGDKIGDEGWELESINGSIDTASQSRKISSDDFVDKGWDLELESINCSATGPSVDFTAESEKVKELMMYHISKLERMYAARAKEIQLSADNEVQQKNDSTLKFNFDYDTMAETAVTTVDTTITTADIAMTTADTPTAAVDTSMATSPCNFSANLDICHESIAVQNLFKDFNSDSDTRVDATMTASNTTIATVDSPLTAADITVTSDLSVLTKNDDTSDGSYILQGHKSPTFIRVRSIKRFNREIGLSSAAGRADVGHTPSDFEMYLIRKNASRGANNWSGNTSDSEEDTVVDVKVAEEDTSSSTFASLVTDLCDEIACNEIKTNALALEITMNINDAECSDDLISSDTEGRRASSNSRYSRICMSLDKGKMRFISPSSDPTLDIKYFGHQRILVKKR